MYWQMWIAIGGWVQETGLLGHLFILSLFLLVLVTGVVIGQEREWRKEVKSRNNWRAYQARNQYNR